MYSGWTFLEGFADGRARRDMRDLITRVLRTATCHRDGHLELVVLDAIVPGERLLNRQDDLVHVDGRIASTPAFLDTSLPRHCGADVVSPLPCNLARAMRR